MFNRKVVEFMFNGEAKYAVRRLTVFGYQYRDLNDNYWWTSHCGLKYCLGTKEQVLNVLLRKTSVKSASKFIEENFKTEEERLEDEKLDRLGVDRE